MAKKRGGGGSNLGLIITLVFFVLSTVILGVTTYMGYSDQEAKEKAKNDMKKERDQFEADAKWYRFLYRTARVYEGTPAAGVDAAELARDKTQFDAGQLSVASNQKDKDDAAKWLKGLNDRMPWDAARATSPSSTFDARMIEKDREIDRLRAELNKVSNNLARANQDAKEEADKLNKEIAARDQALKQIRDQMAAERKADQDDINKKIDAVKVSGTTLAGLREEVNQAKQEAEKMQKLANQERKLRLEANDKRNEMKTKFDDAKRTLDAVVDKTKVDLREIEIRERTTRAKDRLANWNKNWYVVDIDRTGKMPYINLGSADRVVPQLTFNVHSVQPDGHLNTNAKATVEVVRVLAPHLSQVRITSTADPREDPVLKGDRLFHPTWEPDRKGRVVLAGLADMDGDGTDRTLQFRRLLERQNTQIDAYIDVSDDKAPKLVEQTKGQPVSVDTEYIILGNNLREVGHPRARDLDYVKKYEELVKQLKDAGGANAVKLIRLGDYLDMMGYSSGRTRSAGSLPASSR